MFSAKDDSEASLWVSAINSAIDHASSQGTPTTLRQTKSAYGITPLMSGLATGKIVYCLTITPIRYQSLH